MSSFKPKRKQTTTPKIKPEQQFLFEELCAVFKKLGIAIRIEKGYFNGGLCKLEDQELIIINKDLPIDQNIELLTGQLQALDLDHIYVSPKIRSLLVLKNEV
jgi:hypothetical protein